MLVVSREGQLSWYLYVGGIPGRSFSSDNCPGTFMLVVSREGAFHRTTVLVPLCWWYPGKELFIGQLSWYFYVGGIPGRSFSSDNCPGTFMLVVSREGA